MSEPAEEEVVSHEKIARLAKKALAAGDLTVDELAERLGFAPEDIQMALDEYDATQTPPVHVGPGGGHGWIKSD